MELLTGTIPVNNSSLSRTVLVNNSLFTGTVQVNNCRPSCGTYTISVFHLIFLLSAPYILGLLALLTVSWNPNLKNGGKPWYLSIRNIEAPYCLFPPNNCKFQNNLDIYIWNKPGCVISVISLVLVCLVFNTHP